MKTFELKPNDLSARTQPRMDNNGVPGALVKVQLAAQGAVFEGDVMGEVEYTTSEYKVYMPDGSKRLTVKLEGYLPLAVEFGNYGVSSLESKSTYLLILTGVKSVAQGPVQTKDKVTVKDTVYLTRPPAAGGGHKSKTFLLAAVMPTHSMSEVLQQPAFGVTIGQVKRWGWYVNAMSNFVSEESAGAVSSADGTTSDGDLILFNGEKSVSFLQATAGIVYKLSNNFRIMAGAGYGQRTMYAQSEEGLYYTANTASGVSVDAGACLSFGAVSVEAVLCAPVLSGISARLGLGVDF